jgi:putative restriction endonuclease
MIERYLQMFANLRTDRGRDRYPEITYQRAPHKPFLLLSVMDLIAGPDYRKLHRTLQ